MTILADMPQEIMTEYVERTVSKQTVDVCSSQMVQFNSWTDSYISFRKI